MCLTLNRICKTHTDGTVVARDISFTIEKGQLGAIIGPSGCGKTTLLRMVAGFETPDAGAITVNGKPVFLNKRNLRPERRQVGMVFQDYALFPHLTVLENVRFGAVKNQKPDLEKLLDVTGLAGFEKKYPHELSGGQQQRVALARALYPRPSVLLMDEPFSNLDISLRETLSEEVRAILNQYGTTGLLVTHNQHEAFAMADRIGVMKAGRLLQWDNSNRIYHRPASRDVAAFVGEGSFLRGRVLPSGTVETDIGRFESDDTFQKESLSFVTLFVRPEDVMVDHSSDRKGVLVKSHFRGPGRVHTFELASGDQVSCVDKCPAPLEPGKAYGLSVCKRHVAVF